MAGRVPVRRIPFFFTARKQEGKSYPWFSHAQSYHVVGTRVMKLSEVTAEMSSIPVACLETNAILILPRPMNMRIARETLHVTTKELLWF